MAQDVIFGLVGGLGIFIYGMYIMSDALKKLTLNRLKNAGYLFADILIHFNRINKHLENIAEKV